ncbi:MAG: hypothetical protein V3U84_04480, partial [Thiotrichaceae bacterium]
MLLMQSFDKTVKKPDKKHVPINKRETLVRNYEYDRRDKSKYKPVITTFHQRVDKQSGKLTEFLKKTLAMLLRWKYLIMLTTLMISLILVVTYLLMRPTSITISTVLLAGVLSGLFLGSIIASFREWRESLLVSSEDLKNSTGYPVIGVIPAVKHGEQYLAKEIVSKPHS